MLNSMRSKSNRTLMYILMGLLIIGLTGFGISSFTGGSLRNIGSVGDEKISIDTYAQQMNQTLRNVTRQIGRNLSQAEVEASGIQRAVLAEVVATASLDNEANRLGLSVGDEYIRRELLNTPAFQSLSGEFSQESYDFALERAGMDAGQYEDSLRKQEARNLIQSAVTAGIQSDDTAAEAFVAFAAETRDIEWVELTADYLTTPVAEPTEDQIVEHYELNPEDYTAPLTKAITFSWLSPDSLIDEVEVTDAEVREAYEIHSERYNRPARRAVDRIIFGNEAEAKEARAKLDSGVTDFDTLAEERGLVLADIDLGELEREELPEAAAALVFDAPEPGIVGPADTDLGPAIFRINAIFDESITPFEEAEDELREELASEHTGVMVLNMLPEVDDLLAAGASLEEVAETTGMELGNIEFTDEVSEGIAAYDEFRLAAEETEEGDFPEIVSLSDGGVFALRVNSVTQPARIPLEEVRDRVIADWKAAETMRLLKEMAERFADRLQETSDFGSLGLIGAKAEKVNRAGFIEGTPPLMVTQAFGVKVGDAAVVEDVDKVYLALVTEVTPADLESEANRDTVERIRAQIDTQVAQDILGAYESALQTAAGVTLDQGAINAVNTQILASGAGG